MILNYDAWQKKLREYYKNNDHVYLSWSTYELEAVVDEDGEVLDVCIEGVYLAEILSEDFLNQVQDRVDELI